MPSIIIITIHNIPYSHQHSNSVLTISDCTTRQTVFILSRNSKSITLASRARLADLLWTADVRCDQVNMAVCALRRPLGSLIKWGAARRYRSLHVCCVIRVFTFVSFLAHNVYINQMCLRECFAGGFFENGHSQPLKGWEHIKNQPLRAVFCPWKQSIATSIRMIPTSDLMEKIRVTFPHVFESIDCRIFDHVCVCVGASTGFRSTALWLLTAQAVCAIHLLPPEL